MASLLNITSRVEAAVAAYISVKPVPNLKEWERHFHQEKVRATVMIIFIMHSHPNLNQIEAIRQFWLLRANEGTPPPLHPTLVVLFIVLDAEANFSQIGRSHPKWHKHKYYLPGTRFPEDISSLLPPVEARWWETLGKSN